MTKKPTYIDIERKNKRLESRNLILQQTGQIFQERIEFETLLSSLSTKFLKLPTDKFDREVEWTLKRVVETLNVDRSTVFEFTEDNTQLIATHSYTAEGFDKAPSLIRTAQIPWVITKISKGETVLISEMTHGI